MGEKISVKWEKIGMWLFIYEVLGYFIGKKSSRRHWLLYLSVGVCVYLVKRFTQPLSMVTTHAPRTNT